MKKFISLLFSLLIVFGLALTAFAADGTVTIQAPGVFSFAPGSTYSTSDLFDNFKGVMPGDTLTQHIVIKNNWVRYDHIRVFLRAVPHDSGNQPVSGVTAADSNDFLSKLSMTVTDGSGKVIFNASPDELDGLKENVKVASLRRNKTTSLDVSLTVPLELDNEYASRVGEVDWVFTVEGYNDPSNTPKTGDTIMTAVVVLVLSAAALVLLLILGKRKKKK